MIAWFDRPVTFFNSQTGIILNPVIENSIDFRQQRRRSHRLIVCDFNRPESRTPDWLGSLVLDSNML